MEYYLTKDELMHHGILGQKWGVRRYQNEDGTYTAEGKARRNDSLSSKEIKEMKKSMISTSTGSYVPAKSGRDASVLGLKALRKLGLGDVTDEDIAEAEKSERGDYWFLYEDQTIGCAAIASLINAGYSANDCKKLIKYAEYLGYEDLYENGNEWLWELSEGNYEGYLEKFADVCEQIKKDDINKIAEKKIKNPNPPKIIHSENYELYHHGILGQKWGVRRYQNPDGSLTEEGKKRYRKLSSGEYIMTSSGVYKYRKSADGKYIKTTRAERKAIDNAMSPKLKGITSTARKLAKAADEKATVDDINDTKKQLNKKVDDYTKNNTVKNRSPRNKNISELTDKQLEKSIARLKLEKDYADIRNKINELDPKPVSRGEQFTKLMMDKVVVPAMQDAGKKLIEAAINNMTKKDTAEDKYAAAKKESDYMNNLANIENKKADYNRTKALNDKYKETNDINVYETNKKNKDKDNGNNNQNENSKKKDKNKDKERDMTYNGYKLTKEQIKKIGELFNSGTSIKNIANSTNTSTELIAKYLFGHFS